MYIYIFNHIYVSVNIYIYVSVGILIDQNRDDGLTFLFPVFCVGGLKTKQVSFDMFWPSTGSILGGSFPILFIFTPNLGEMIQFDFCIFFQMAGKKTTN